MDGHRGIYICIEGLDGCGKSTLFKEVTRRLQESAFPFDTVCPTRASEPPNWLEKLFRRSAFLRNSSAFRAFVYAARSSRACATTDWSKPLILGDRSVITSYVTRWRRWFDSPFLSRLAVDVLEPRIPGPDHVVFLDAPMQMLRQRLNHRGAPLDIDETTERALQMRRAYEEIRSTGCVPRLGATSWHIVDASRSPEAVADEVWHLLTRITPEIVAEGHRRLLTEIA